MPGSFCVVCRARIPRGSRCTKHRLQSPSSRRWHEPGAARARIRALRRAEYRCERCGRMPFDLHVHHIRPASEGGGNEPENLRTLCLDCHQKEHECD